MPCLYELGRIWANDDLPLRKTDTAKVFSKSKDKVKNFLAFKFRLLKLRLSDIFACIKIIKNLFLAKKLMFYGALVF